MRILLAEDQEKLNSVVTHKLTKEGYVVDSCYDGEDAWDYIESTEYDVVLLDIMMPGISGLEVLKKMRSTGNHTPVIMMTALGQTDDKITGLDMGADDYLVKPVDLDEMIARIRSVVRRSGNKASNIIQIQDLTVDIAAKSVTRAGEDIPLTAKEYNIFEYLVQNSGRIISKEQILDHIWNFDFEGDVSIIDVYMHHIRKKVDGKYENKLIRTVKGAGYVVK